MRCDACAFHYVNPEPSQAELNAFYAGEYQFGHHEGCHGREDHHNRVVLAKLRRLGVKSLMDLGSAQGRFVHMAREAGIDANGVELMAENVRAAREHYGIALQEASVAAYLATNPRNLEAITILNVLEHSPDPLAITKQMHAAARPGGLVVAIVPNVSFTLTLGTLRSLVGIRDKYMLESKRFGQQGFHPPVHLSSFDAAHLRSLFERAGFRVLHIGQAPIVGTTNSIMNIAKRSVFIAGRALEIVTGGHVVWGYSLMIIAQRP